MTHPLMEQLIVCRKASKIRQKDLADQSYISPEHISRIERGVCSPSLEKFCDMAEALGYEVILKKQNTAN